MVPPPGHGVSYPGRPSRCLESLLSVFASARMARSAGAPRAMVSLQRMFEILPDTHFQGGGAPIR